MLEPSLGRQVVELYPLLVVPAAAARDVHFGAVGASHAIPIVAVPGRLLRILYEQPDGAERTSAATGQGFAGARSG